MDIVVLPWHHHNSGCPSIAVQRPKRLSTCSIVEAALDQRGTFSDEKLSISGGLHCAGDVQSTGEYPGTSAATIDSIMAIGSSKRATNHNYEHDTNYETNFGKLLLRASL